MKKIQRLSKIIIILFVVHTFAPVAAAHPLGNFTINQYTGLIIHQDKIDIDYILDMAEIPAFQEIASFDANNNGQPDGDEVTDYHLRQCDFVGSKLSLNVESQQSTLMTTASSVTFPAGAGGLPTLRLACSFTAAVNQLDENTQLTFENHVYTERLGWREIVVQAEGVSLPDDLVALAHSTTNRLTAYPDDLLYSPLDQRSISFVANAVEDLDALTDDTINADNALGEATVERSAAYPQNQDRFTELIKIENLTIPTIILALIIAFVWGAAHAMTPGHGKTIVAAYLVGSRGTMKQALILGLTTTFTHTAGVFALGFITLFASRFIVPEMLYPWLGVFSGVLVVWIGLSLFGGRLRGLIGQAESRHHHDHHHDELVDHHHDHLHHHHGDGHMHTHLPPDDAQAITWRSLIALGVSGGLIPCPSALIVMLSAIALGRIGFGMVLIVAFSLGLAGVLTLIGILWVQARQLVERTSASDRFFARFAHSGKLLQLAPMVSSLFITIIGIGITVQSLAQTGAIRL